MQLKQATPEELGLIVDLVNQAYRGESGHGWTSEIELISGARIDLASLRAVAAGPSIVFAATGDDGRLLGCVSLCPVDEGPWYLFMLAVDPSRQAGGIGKAIMEQVEQYAVRHGARDIRISVINLRVSLIDWYERRGYRKTGVVESFPYNDPSVGTPLRDDLALVMLIKQLAADRQP